VSPTLRSFRAALVLVILVAAALWGCSSNDNGPTAPVQGTFADLVALGASSVPKEFVVPSNVDLAASLAASSTIDGKRQSFAAFHDGYYVVDAGEASVRVPSPSAGPGDSPADSLLLDKRSVLVGGMPNYVYTTLLSHPAGVAQDLEALGRFRFKVTGSTSVHAFEDSVGSVTGISATAPAPAAAVTRANGLTITWSPAGSDTTVYTSAMVFMRADSSKSVTSGVARDIDGTLAMSESQLLKLPAGAATLVLARYRLRNIFPSSRKVGLMTEMAESRPITLQ
jgi:hypothetical protein